MASGDILKGDLVTLADNQVIRGVKHFANRIAFLPQTTQTLAASDAILASESVLIQVGGSGGAVTLTSEPTIAEGDPGQLLILVGTSDANTVTIQDLGALAGSNVDMGGVNRTLGLSDYLVLIFNEETDNWEEIVFKNN